MLQINNREKVENPTKNIILTKAYYKLATSTITRYYNLEMEADASASNPGTKKKGFEGNKEKMLQRESLWQVV